MEGTAKRQANAEEMLAELKRVVELSTRAPQAPPPSASTTPKSGSPRRETRRSHWGIDPPDKAIVDRSIGPRTDLQKATRPRSRSWTPIAGGIALAAAAAIGVSFALINKAPNLPEREPSVTSAAGPVRSQNEPALKPSSDSPSLMGVARHAEAVGALEAPPPASEASANSAPIPVPEKAAPGAPNLASFGLDAAPAFTPVPPSSPAVQVPTQRIGPDGAPIASGPSTPPSTGSGAPLAQAPKPAAPAAPSQAIKQDGAPTVTAPSTAASTGSTAPLAEAPKAAAAAAASQAKPNTPPIATAPGAPASTGSTAPLAEAPKAAAAAAASQAIKSNTSPVASAPATPASSNSAPHAGTPKPNARPTASLSNEFAAPSMTETELRKTPPERPSPPKPRKSAKASAKPMAEPARRSTEPTPPKEAEKSPEPPQAASSPTALAPARAPTVQQRVADGVTHAFGYLVHLPGALVPHLGGSNANAQ